MQGLCTSSGVWDTGGAQIVVLHLRGARMVLPAWCLASLTGATAQTPFTRGLPVRDVIVG